MVLEPDESSSAPNSFNITLNSDHLCGLVVRVPGYRSRGPDSIPSATDFLSSVSGTRSTQPREYN
jgi:hypothetical protein